MSSGASAGLRLPCVARLLLLPPPGHRVAVESKRRVRVEVVPRQYAIRVLRQTVSLSCASTVAADLFVVPTIRCQVLYIFIILGLERARSRPPLPAGAAISTVLAGSRLI